MRRMCAEHAVAVMVGWATAGMISNVLIGGCASSASSHVVADASADWPADTSISTDASSVPDASAAENFCTGPATGALIDDMSGSSISLKPPPCGTKGTWYPISTGTLTIPTVDSLYSPLPAGFPGATGDAGVAPGAQAMCVAGKTGTSQYDGAGMQLVLAGTGSVPALIDASDYAGIQFWLWVSPDTAASVSSSLLVGIFDKNQTPGGGVCDVNSSGANACGYAAAAVSSTMAQNHGSGRLFADDGSKLTALSGGWQHVWAPWSSFTTNPYWGGANEAKVDPRTLGAVELWVEQDNTSGSAVPFDFCVYELSFLPKSDLPALDGGAEDGGETVTFCTGPATGALIDDMSGSSISLTPPPCGTKGTWYAISDGTLTIPTVDPSIASNCGSDCQSLYSPLPAGFPGATGDAGVAPGAQAMCVAGTTGTSQYGGAGMQLVLGWSGAVPDGGAYATDAGTMVPAPALIDASDYGGIEFLLWVSPDTAAAVASSFEVALVDKNQLRGGGKCDPTDTTSIHACAGATAGVSFSVAAASEGTGPLFGADGSELTTLVGGWQLVRAPWSSFLANPYYGGANESVVDPKTLAFADFVVAQDRPSGPAIPFDFCIYGLTFYR